MRNHSSIELGLWILLGLLIPVELVTLGDANAQTARQESIEIGQLVQGVLSRDDADGPYRAHHADFYLLQGYAGQRLELLMTSEVVDTYLVLQDTAGVRLLDDDDGAGNLDSRILVTIPLDGLYTIIATSYSQQQGPYELLVREFHPQPVIYEALDEGRPIHGALIDSDATRSDNRRVDGYQFEGELGQWVRLTASSETFDTYLYVLAPTGELLAENDDGLGGGTDSEISLQLSSPGLYRVLVTSFGTTFGDYVVELSRVSREPILDRPLAFGEPTTGSLEPGDGAWSSRGAYADGYLFDGERGQTIEITMTSAEIDTYLALIAPDGTVAAENDDSGGVEISRIHTMLPADGEYRIIATSYGLESGGYILTATEHDLRPLERQRLRVGRRRSGELSADDPLRTYEPAHVDLYEVDLDVGQRVVASMRSSVLNSYLWVVAPSGEVVSEDDDSGEGLDALVEITAPYEGTYLVVATSYPGLTGPYEVMVEDAVERGEATRVALTIGEPQIGRLEYGDDITPIAGTYRDQFIFDAEAETQVEIRMESDEVDALLQLLGPNGTLLAQDDDGGAGFNARLHVILPETGSYVVYATTYEPAIGDYSVSVAEFEAVPVEPTLISVGDSVEGDLERADARSLRYATLLDVYELDGEQGDSLRFTMSSAAFDPYLIVVDPNGEQAGEDDDSGGGLNAQLDLTLPMTGRYRILATSGAFGEGAYRLSIEESAQAAPPTPFHTP